MVRPRGLNNILRTKSVLGEGSISQSSYSNTDLGVREDPRKTISGPPNPCLLCKLSHILKSGHIARLLDTCLD